MKVTPIIAAWSGTDAFLKDFERKLDEKGFMWSYVTSLAKGQAQRISAITSNDPNLQAHPPEYYEETVRNGALLVHDGTGDIVASILAHRYDFEGTSIYERGGLWVDPMHRSEGIGRYLVLKMTATLWNRALISVTKQPRVWSINQKAMPFELHDLTGAFRKKLEEVGPLTDDYRYFINGTLKSILFPDA